MANEMNELTDSFDINDRSYGGFKFEAKRRFGGLAESITVNLLMKNSRI